MNLQLELIIKEFKTAQERLHRLVTEVSEEEWARHANPNRWSIAECVAHLNLTSEAYLPLMLRELEASQRSRGSSNRYRRDLLGWLIWRMAGPPARFRAKTPASFVPAAAESASILVARFDSLQAEQVGCVRAGDGLPLDESWILSPFNPRLRYNLYSCFTILPRHQHRHLWQAEQVRLASKA